MSARLVLYGTSGCSLCVEALEMAVPIAQAFGWAVEEVDVAEDDSLLARFGDRVPVLRRSDTEEELGWPFDARAVQEIAAKPRASD